VRFAAITICLALAWRYASHKPLRQYFAVNLVCAAALELALLWWAYDSTAYAVIACVCILAILPFEFSLVWNAICFIPVRFFLLAPSFALAVLMVWVTKPLGMFQWIQHVNGALDLFCALPAGIGAAYQQGMARKIALSLSFLWLSQSLFEFGLGLHLGDPAWVLVNGWLPTFLVAAGSLWIAFLARQYTQSDLRA
jgi:hypothetical protein